MMMTDNTGQANPAPATVVPAPPVGLSGHGSKDGASPGAPSSFLWFTRDETSEDWSYGCGTTVGSEILPCWTEVDDSGPIRRTIYHDGGVKIWHCGDRLTQLPADDMSSRRRWCSECDPLRPRVEVNGEPWHVESIRIR